MDYPPDTLNIEFHLFYLWPHCRKQRLFIVSEERKLGVEWKATTTEMWKMLSNQKQ